MTKYKSKRSGSIYIYIAFVAVTIVFIVMIGTIANGDYSNPIDPRKGYVRVSNSAISKICDGSTLIYTSGGTVPNSPECKP
jgi:hypothetical protein